MEYHLVHITTSGEYAAPLVASQLFDQAEVQASVRTPNAPLSVSAWIIAPMREIFSKQARDKVNVLRKRCPDVSIKFIGGINRVNNFPAIPDLLIKRLLLGKNTNVVYHCRTERAAIWGMKMKEYFPGDKLVVDIRGYWGAELLYRRGIEDPVFANNIDAAEFDKANAYLKDAIGWADAVTTVSQELRTLLIDKFDAKESTTVVPCCVKEISDDSYRNEIRSKWGISEHEIGIVYSGTAAAYQHLDDLTLPFLYQLSKQNRNIRVIILTPDIARVQGMLSKYDFERPVILQNVPQHDVAKYLTAADVGILIRKPTLVNRVANPVKIAEYLASGLSIIAEYGVGGIPPSAYENGVIKGIRISTGDDTGSYVASVNSWLKEKKFMNRTAARKVAKDNYYWGSMIQVHRQTYADLLNGHIQPTGAITKN